MQTEIRARCPRDLRIHLIPTVKWSDLTHRAQMHFASVCFVEAMHREATRSRNAMIDNLQFVGEGAPC